MTSSYLDSRHIQSFADSIDGVTGRPETMCPRTNVLGPLVPKLFVPGDTISLHWYIQVILHYTCTICIGSCKMAGMYQCSDTVFPGRFILGTWGPRKFVGGHTFRDVPSPHLYSYVLQFPEWCMRNESGQDKILSKRVGAWIVRGVG